MMNKYIQTSVGVVILFVIWQIVSFLGIFNPIFFASPLEVAKEAVTIFKSASIYQDILSTLYRVSLSIVIATIIGVPIGILLGYFSKVYKFFEAIVDFLRSIPPIVMYPLLLISLGPGDASRIGTAVFGGITVIILIISRGLFQQDRTRQLFFRSKNISTLMLLKEVVWYEALPHTMTAIRTATSISLIVVIVTEMLVGGRHGLGARVQQVQITSNIPDLFATVIVIGILGVLFNKFLGWVDKKYVFWKQ